MAYKPQVLNVAEGGTGKITLTNHGLLIGQATGAIAITAAGSAGQVIQSGGASADPAYSTATYPSTATGTGKILRADGTNWAASTATYPDTAGTSGNLLTSDGTNWVSSAAPAVTFNIAQGTLTNAQIKALKATPVIAIAAPASGSFIKVHDMAFKLVYGGSNVFTAPGPITVNYNSSSSAVVGTGLTGANIISSTSNTNMTVISTITAVSTLIEALPITIDNLGASEIAGNAANNNTIKWWISYSTIVF